MLSRLSDLLCEVRALAREADRRSLAQCAVRGCEYDDCLMSILDGWMSSCTGHDLLVCFGAALELGVVPEQHISRCMAAATEARAKAVRVLFWTGMRRIDIRSISG